MTWVKRATLAGSPGPKGDKGDKGDRGDTGTQGVQGAQGDAGDDGTVIVWGDPHDSLAWDPTLQIGGQAPPGNVQQELSDAPVGSMFIDVDPVTGGLQVWKKE